MGRLLGRLPDLIAHRLEILGRHGRSRGLELGQSLGRLLRGREPAAHGLREGFQFRAEVVEGLLGLGADGGGTLRDGDLLLELGGGRLERGELGLQGVDLGRGALGHGRGGGLRLPADIQLDLADAAVAGFGGGARIVAQAVDLRGQRGPQAGLLGEALGLAAAVPEHGDDDDQGGAEDTEDREEGLEAVLRVKVEAQHAEDGDEVGGYEEPFFLEQFLEVAVHGDGVRDGAQRGRSTKPTLRWTLESVRKAVAWADSAPALRMRASSSRSLISSS